jgi:hypothetical protein
MWNMCDDVGAACWCCWCCWCCCVLLGVVLRSATLEWCSAASMAQLGASECPGRKGRKGRKVTRQRLRKKVKLSMQIYHKSITNVRISLFFKKKSIRQIA